MKRFDGLGQYVAVLTDTLFTGSLIRTLIYTLVVVAIEMVLGLAVALLFAREFPGIRLIRTLYLTPILMVPIMVGLLWSLMYQPSIGIVNYVLGLFGIEPLNWLASSSLALPAVAIAEIWQWTPFAAMVFVAGLQGLPAERHRRGAARRRGPALPPAYHRAADDAQRRSPLSSCCASSMSSRRSG